jgi:ankyrin repeat protein
VYCQVVYICGLIPARIRHALAELPETLDETYQRTLQEINRAEWEIAHRLFQFVAVARRPLRVKELAELLAFDFEAGSIPKFHEGWRPEDPVDAVLSTCSSLLAIVDDGYHLGKVIQFSHFSVKEFLTSARLAEASDIIHRRYYISMTPAHTLAAQACLGILLHLDKDVVTKDSLDEIPLAEYAAGHWADHALLEDVSQNVEDGWKQLFDPNKPHLSVCSWIHDPGVRWWERQTERPLPPRGTPLHYAALWNLRSIVEFLIIERPQDVHSRGITDNATPLHLASEEGHVKVARCLLEHDADVTARNAVGSTPLHLASQFGQAEVVGMLIEHGADVTAQNKVGSTPLHVASQLGPVEVIGMLIERGADVTAQDGGGSTPLHLASKWERMDVVGILIKYGADATAQNEDGDTPLHLASLVGGVEIAGMLIEHGADVTAQNKQGQTPLHLASKWGPLHLASQEGQLEISSMLIERGADVTTQDEYGLIPLHLAAQNGQVKVTDMLIERGADVTAQSKDGSTPLHRASFNGHVEIVGILIEHGADVTAQNEDGLTPLHLASQEGQVEVVGVLNERGADVTALNVDSTTRDSDAATET